MKKNKRFTHDFIGCTKYIFKVKQASLFHIRLTNSDMSNVILIKFQYMEDISHILKIWVSRAWIHILNTY